jgi:hypothetical protein
MPVSIGMEDLNQYVTCAVAGLLFPLHGYPISFVNSKCKNAEKKSTLYKRIKKK